MRIALMLACLLAAFGAQAAEIAPGGDLRAAIAALRPGDTLELAGGTYTMSSSFRVTVNGTAQAPITIRARAGQRPVIQQNNAGQNIIEISGSSHVVFQGIGFTGGSHGIRLMSSSFVTIQDCEIWETGDVALSANSGGTYDGLRILRNHIHHTNGTGEGMYLGCNSDACRVANSLIEGNYIHHTNRASVEQGDGIELKEGSYGNVIRDNVVHDTNYPGIITYSTAGNGPANVIEGNVVWNTNDYAIQSAADSIIRNNIVLGSAIALQPHQAGSPSNQQVVHNTVIVQNSGIEVRGVVGPVVIANNAVYSESGTAIRLISGSLGQVTVAGNVGRGGIEGKSSGFVAGQAITADLVDGHYRGEPPIDVFPAAGSALIGAGNASYRTERDFNGTLRTGADAGAYQYSASGNPGWTITAGFKTAAGSTAPPRPPQNLRVE
jgi:hypothetical protein